MLFALVARARARRLEFVSACTELSDSASPVTRYSPGRTFLHLNTALIRGWMLPCVVHGLHLWLLRWLLRQKRDLGRVGGAPGHVVSQFSGDPSDPLPAKQALFIQTRGLQGKIHTRLFPLKRGVCTFIFTCLPGRTTSCVTIQFVDFSQGAGVGTAC